MTYLSAKIVQRRPQAATISEGESVPAPVRGWNARDPIFEMDPGFAIALDNYFPQSGYVELRGGQTVHATGVGAGAVEFLFSYRSTTFLQLLAGGGGSIYNATAAGAVGAALGTGFTSNRWQAVNFNGRGIFVNGADAPQSWNGTTLTAAGFTGTGLTPADLVNVAVFKSRLFFAQNNSASFWYGAINAVTGALTEFPLAAVHPSGGNLVSIGTLTLDGGSGPDDYVVFLMESGDVIVYAGTDPTAASTFALVGIFNLGRPIGRRSLVKVGPDLVAITADGYIPMRQFLVTARSRPQLAVSDAISGAVNQAVRDFGANFGWQPVLYPRGNWLLVNVPLVVGQQAVQHVMNTRTGAWCRFTNWPASSWVVHNDRLYFGGTGGRVHLADEGFADNGIAIEGDATSAYTYFGGRGLQKHFKMFRPILASDSDLNVGLGLGVDFAETIPVVTTTSAAPAAGVWDVATWDVDEWAGGLAIQKQWRSTGQIGYAAAVRLKTSTNNQLIRWYSTDVLFEKGGFI